jgi:hypothetical protein
MSPVLLYPSIRDSQAHVDTTAKRSILAVLTKEKPVPHRPSRLRTGSQRRLVDKMTISPDPDKVNTPPEISQEQALRTLAKILADHEAAYPP